LPDFQHFWADFEHFLTLFISRFFGKQIRFPVGLELFAGLTPPNLKFVKITLNQGKGIRIPQGYVDVEGVGCVS